MVRVLGDMECACKSVGQNKSEKSKIVAKRKLVQEGAVAGFDCVCESTRASGRKTISFAESIKLRQEGTGNLEV